MSEVRKLTQRRDALQATLNDLRDRHERATREHSFALARERSGVGNTDALGMQTLADGQAAGEPAIADVRRELEAIDGELARTHANGLRGGGRRLLGRLRP